MTTIAERLAQIKLKTNKTNGTVETTEASVPLINTLLPTNVVGSGDIAAQLRQLASLMQYDNLPPISEQLMVIQRELKTPYLADTLEIEDIGLLVAAKRREMAEDMLGNTKEKKTRATATRISVTAAMSMSLDDL